MPQPQGKTFRSLAALFSALPEAELDASVHLVDDGSSDGTGDAVRQAYPSVSVITGGRNSVLEPGNEDGMGGRPEEGCGFLPVAE